MGPQLAPQGHTPMGAPQCPNGSTMEIKAPVDLVRISTGSRHLIGVYTGGIPQVDHNGKPMGLHFTRDPNVSNDDHLSFLVSFHDKK